MTEPDPHTWPVHPRGTWQRALVFRAAGLEPERADEAALERWQALGTGERSRITSKRNALASTVRYTAYRALEPGEVLGVNKMAARVKAVAPDLPHYHAVRDILKATLPFNPADATDEDGKPSSRRLFKVYRDDLGARPGHYFARRPGDVDAYAKRRRARYAEQGRITAEVRYGHTYTENDIDTNRKGRHRP